MLICERNPDVWLKGLHLQTHAVATSQLGAQHTDSIRP